MYVQDTIAAISTPLGEGGIGIVRVSGERAMSIAVALFKGKSNGGFQSHRFYYGDLIDPIDGRLVDEVLIVLMRAPRSYTREDVLEIHCHGGYLLVQKVLELVLGQGVRLAEPGEFTRRAFLNGRIDLVQAEAVIDIIRGKTDAALALAQHQREGLLSQRLAAVRERLVEALALVEAYIDFPEDDIGVVDTNRIASLAEVAQSEIENLLSGFREGRVLRDGVSVMIAGKPNVGKSSLLNTLLREKRAIVTSVPGTTRDIIEEVVNIHGLPVRMLDTAGIRETADLVEQEGVRLAMERIRTADLVLFVLDSTRLYERDDAAIFTALCGRKAIVVINKSDLPRTLVLPDAFAGLPVVEISTLTGAAIDHLRSAIFDMFLSGRAVDSRDYVAVSQARHRDALARGRDALAAFAADRADDLALEILAIHLREALRAVGEVTGETTPDEVLDLIFQRFCIGK
jgi:tRNA modification GTPase